MINSMPELAGINNEEAQELLALAKTPGFKVLKRIFDQRIESLKEESFNMSFSHFIIDAQNRATDIKANPIFGMAEAHGARKGMRLIIEELKDLDAYIEEVIRLREKEAKLTQEKK